MTMQTDHFFPSDTAGIPLAEAARHHALSDGARVDLRISPVTKRIGDSVVRMLAYNGSVPGPTLHVRQGSRVTVDVTNDGDLDATVHWHGLRLDNRFDGTTETQVAMPLGGRFSYQLELPDPGVYWYHPHIREDYGQEMGLYGNIIVVPEDPDYWPRVNREIAVTLDDILLEDGRVAPFRRSESTHVAMGRFGNVFLLNGEPELTLTAQKGEVVRFYLTNTANTRVFRIALPGARMKRVGGDSGRVEREEIIETLILAPSERAVVDVLFSSVGEIVLEHRTPRRTHALGRVRVTDDEAEPSLREEFEKLRVNPDMVEARAIAAQYLPLPPPDKTLGLVAEMEMGPEGTPNGEATEYYCPMHADVVQDEPGRCAKCAMKLLARAKGSAAARSQVHAHVHDDGTDDPADTQETMGIEWEDDMVEVNRITTTANTRWKLIDRDAGAEGSAIAWRFRVGDRVKIRLVNEMDSDHPMHHPFHIHGAGRFLVLARDGEPEQNLVWKDTVLVPTGRTVDLLLEVTNPGRWMAHCHIAEHHESGMMLGFDVTV